MENKRKPWRLMTTQEINELSRTQCAHCKYYGKESQTAGVAKPCDYIGIVGHRRGCDPRDCVKMGIFEYADEKKRRTAWRAKTKS